MTRIICPRTGFRCTSSGCAQPCEPVTQPAPAIPLGWQCPVCHVVLSPYAGIGSEGYVSLQLDRRFVGIELKDSYYRQARANLASALQTNGQLDLSDQTTTLGLPLDAA